MVEMKVKNRPFETGRGGFEVFHIPLLRVFVCACIGGH